MTDQNIKILSKFLEYVLGRHPDEFGLLLDERGYCKIKTLLQALHEDPEWRHVRQGQLNTLLLLERPAPIEMEGGLIRARNRDRLPEITSPSQLPKLLYTTVRQKAHPVVLDKGLRPGGLPYILLSAEKPLAQRLGRRIDNTPVLITVQVTAAQSAGVVFQQYGAQLYLADHLPPEVISAPPLPKEKPQAVQAPKKRPDPVQPKTPGSFFPDLTTNETPHQQHSRRAEKDWKKDRRRARKEKQRRGWE